MPRSKRRRRFNKQEVKRNELHSIRDHRSYVAGRGDLAGVPHSQPGTEIMDHKPSSVMTDRDGQFQRCWGCGARRRIAALGPGLWDKVHSWMLTAAMMNAHIRDSMLRVEPTQQELVDELFTQPSPFDKRG